MEKAIVPLYQIGQDVMDNSDKEVGKVLGFSYDGDNGWSYKVSSSYADVMAKKIVEGIKILNESEISPVEGSVQ